jgi:hypothetical protein
MVDEGRTPQAPTSEEEQRALAVTRYRERLHEVDDQEWEVVLERMHTRESTRAIMRDLVERGLCADLKPSSVNVYLSKIRKLLGLTPPGEPGGEEATPEEPPEEPIEAQDALRKLDWLIRKQFARVRRAIALERRMAGFILPQTAVEIRLAAHLVAMRVKYTPKAERGGPSAPVETAAPDPWDLVQAEVPGLTRAGAYRVVMAYERLMRVGVQLGWAEPPPADGPSKGGSEDGDK